MKPVLSNGYRFLILGTLWLVSAAGLCAVDFTGSPDFKLVYDTDVKVADFVNQSKGWTGAVWWTGLTSTTTQTPGVSLLIYGDQVSVTYGDVLGQTTGTATSAAQSPVTVNVEANGWFHITATGGLSAMTNASISFRLWDHDTTPTHLVDATSSTASTISLNHAPTVALANDTEARVEFPFDALTSGIDITTLLSDVLGRQIFADADKPSASLQNFGVAITGAANTGSSYWEYLAPGADATSGWVAIDTTQITILANQVSSLVAMDSVNGFSNSLATVPSSRTALLLAGISGANGFVPARLRFHLGTNDAANVPAIALTFQVWDRTDEQAPSSGTYVTLPTNAATTSPYSIDTVSVTVGLNHAPVALVDGSVYVDPAVQDASNHITIPVSALITYSNANPIVSYFTDEDGDEIGVAITTMALSPSGVWEYNDGNIANGWTDFTTGTINASNWLYLRSQASLRFTPTSSNFSANYPVISDLTFKAWNVPALRQTATGVGSPQGSGGCGNLSVASVSSIMLNVVGPNANHAPTLNAEVSIRNLGTVTYGASTPITVNVSTLVTDFYDADYDTLGIAVTATDTSHGTWQYQPYGGNWTDFPAIPAGSALFLGNSVLVQFRFTDATGLGFVDVASPATFPQTDVLTYRAWDGSDSIPSGTVAMVSGGNSNSSVSYATQSPSMTLSVPVATVTGYFVQNDQIVTTVAAQVGVPLTFSFMASTSRSGGSVTIADPSTHDGWPSWLQVSVSGGTATFTGTPPAGTGGSQSGVLVTASDTVWGSASQSITIAITPSTVTFQHRPSSDGTPGFTAIATQPFSFLVHAATDIPSGSVTITPPNNTWTWHVTSFNAATNIFQITGTPAANASGLSTLTASATDGDVTQTLSFGVTVLPAIATTGLVAPTIAMTAADEMPSFTAIGGGTPAGVTAILAALSHYDHTQARAFAWDAQAVRYVELPTQPTGGLLPEHAIFVVTRVDLGLDLNGVPQAMPFTMTLYPGWNFLTVPPLTADGTSISTSHPWNYFAAYDQDGQVIAGGIAAPYWWDGTAYQQVSSLDSFKGYWFHNTGTTNIRLVRQSAPAVAPHIIATAADRYGARRDNTPPAPPSIAAPEGSAAEHDVSATGSCGLGSGITGLGIMLLMVLRAMVLRVRSGSQR